jgi:hypothetical protein
MPRQLNHSIPEEHIEVKSQKGYFSVNKLNNWRLNLGRRFTMIRRDIFSYFCMVFVLVFLTLSMADGMATDEQGVFMDPESLVRGLYSAVTFDAGSVPDWDPF